MIFGYWNTRILTAVVSGEQQVICTKVSEASQLPISLSYTTPPSPCSSVVKMGVLEAGQQGHQWAFRGKFAAPGRKEQCGALDHRRKGLPLSSIILGISSKMLVFPSSADLNPAPPVPFIASRSTGSHTSVFSLLFLLGRSTFACTQQCSCAKEYLTYKFKWGNQRGLETNRLGFESHQSIFSGFVALDKALNFSDLCFLYLHKGKIIRAYHMWLFWWDTYSCQIFNTALTKHKHLT